MCTIQSVEAFAWHEDLLTRRGADYDPRLLARIFLGQGVSAANYARALRRRAVLAAAFAREMADIDALVLPTVAVVAPAFAECEWDEDGVRTRLLRNTWAASRYQRPSFWRAAQRLGLSQPPLSRQIQQLEEHVGVPLVLRTRRVVELTEAGRQFLEEARSTLREIERAVEAAAAPRTARADACWVGFVDAAIYSVVPEIAKRFVEHRPRIELVLADMLIPDQVDALEERRLHVGLVHPPVDRPSLSTEPLLREPLVVALPDAHPLARRRRGGGVVARRRAARAVPAAGQSRAVRRSLPSLPERRGLRPGGDPTRLAEADDRRARLGRARRRRPPGQPPPSPPAGRHLPTADRAQLTVATILAWQSDETSANVARFCDLVREVCEDLRAGWTSGSAGSMDFDTPLRTA